MDLRKNLYVAPYHSKCPHGLPPLPPFASKSARVWKAMVLGLCPQPPGLLRHGVALKMVCEGIQGTNWDSKKKMGSQYGLSGTILIPTRGFEF